MPAQRTKKSFHIQKMRKPLLALTTNHDTGIALYLPKRDVFDIEDVFCINEERLNRNKFTRRFPKESLKMSREISKVQFDKVLVASEYTPVFILKLLNPWYSKLRLENPFSILIHFYVHLHYMLHKVKLLKTIDLFLSRKLYKKKLNVKSKDIIFLEHHHCHSAGAYYTSGQKKALIFTLDAMGDALSFTVSIGEGKDLKQIFSQYAYNGIGMFYGKITSILGYKPTRHEGKITGLAAYGKIREDILAIMMGMFSFDDQSGGFSKLNYCLDLNKTHGLYEKLKSFPKKDVAASAQECLENEVCRMVSFWIKKAGIKSVCLSGGIFANVKLNQRIHELKEVKDIYIFPHMGDGGLAFGAILSYLKPKPFKLSNVFLGPGYSEEEIKKAIKDNRLSSKYYGNIEEKIAELLSKGKIVARFAGRMEFGPRALGNRSILYQATDKKVNDWLNRKLKRTEFMPFAPAVLEEYAKKCFRDIDGAEYTARFMNITFKCTDYLKEACPGVVHIDGTARPQLVRKKENPSFHKIIQNYHRITGIPGIINTSLNMHEEPIVCTPDEAISAFKKADLDHLALGNFLVQKD